MKTLSVLGALLLTACVTINIYFPAAAAEKAADEIIKDIQSIAPQKAKPEPEPSSSVSDWQLAVYPLIDHVIEAFISPARADEANLTIDSPQIRQLRAAMESRFSALHPFYAAGSIGILAEGLLVVRDPKSVPLQDRSKVNALVTAENADRQKLYLAIANANGHPEWAIQIQATFAARWISNAQSGWWYQSAGSWKQK